MSDGQLSTKFKKAVKKYGNEEWFSDIVDAKWIMLSCVVLALILSIVYLYVLQECAFIIMVLCLGTFIISMLSLGFFCLWNYNHIKNDDDPNTDNENYYLIAACIILGVTLVFMFLFCCLWDRIVLASRIIQATADYITDIKRIIFIPLVFLFLIILYIIYWALSGAYIWSIGESYHKKGSPYGNVKWNENTKYMLFVKLFSLLWVVAFLHYAC